MNSLKQLIAESFQNWRDETGQKREYGKRVKFYRALLREEIDRTLNTYLGDIRESLQHQLESEETAKERIRRNPRITRIHEKFREEAVEIVWQICQIALEEAKCQYGLRKHSIHINNGRMTCLLERLDKADEELMPMQMERISRAPDPPEPPRPPIIIADPERLKVESEAEALARDFRRSNWRLLPKKYWALLKAVVLVAIDSILAFIVIQACVEGTAWFFNGMTYFLASSIIITTIWSAHQFVTGKRFWGIVLLAITAAMGYLRVSFSGEDGLDPISLALSTLTIVPIPVLAFLVARCLDQANHLGKLSSINTIGIDEIRTDLEYSKIFRRKNEAITNHNAETADREQKDFRARQTNAHNDRRRQLLEYISAFENQLMEIQRWFDSFNRQTQTLASDSTNELTDDFSVILADLSLKRPIVRKVGGKNGNDGQLPRKKLPSWIDRLFSRSGS